MARIEYYDWTTNTLTQQALPNTPPMSAPAPKINYEPVAASHSTEWSLMLGGIVALVMLLISLAALAVQHFGFMTLVVSGPLVFGGLVAIAVGILNHQAHLAYHRAVIGQMQPQEPMDMPHDDGASWRTSRPPSFDELWEDKLCRLVERAFDEGDCTKIRTGDRRVYTSVYRQVVTKEDCDKAYEELRMRGILQQNASSKQWEVVPGMTKDSALAVVDAAYQ